jgi:cAMP phosphodiesterase
MKVRILGCHGSELQGKHPPGFLLDNHLLLDAGTVTSRLSVAAQQKIRWVLLSHSHFDHLKDLLFLSENRRESDGTPLEVLAVDPVIRALREHIFNDVIWPDFTKLPSPEKPRVSFCRLIPGNSVPVGPYTVTPIPTRHPVPSCGYLVESEDATLLYTGDTGPTELIWKAASEAERLDGIIVETSFPNRYADLARLTGHLTPSMLAAELRRYPLPQVPVLVYGMKPEYLDEITRELLALGDGRIAPLREGTTLRLGGGR